MSIQIFKELTVWQKSMKLAKEIYVVTEKLPRTELYGLSSQMRRCAVSIPSNIAEGSKRKTTKDFLQFLHIADGTCSELETQLLLTKDLFTNILIDEPTALLTEVQRMLGAMMKSLYASLL